jgi:hypothetical protein
VLKAAPAANKKKKKAAAAKSTDAAGAPAKPQGQAQQSKPQVMSKAQDAGASTDKADKAALSAPPPTPQEIETLRGQLNKARSLDRAGKGLIRAFGYELTPMGVATCVSNAKKKFRDAAIAYRGVAGKLELVDDDKWPSDFPKRDNLKKELKGCCERLTAMWKLQSEPEQNAKIRWPTMERFNLLKEHKQLEFKLPEKYLLPPGIYRDKKTGEEWEDNIIEVRVRLKPVDNVEVPEWTFHVHPEHHTKVDRTKNFLKDLTVEDIAKAHIKPAVYKNRGAEWERAMRDQGWNIKVYRCDIEPELALQWLQAFSSAPPSQ